MHFIFWRAVRFKFSFFYWQFFPLNDDIKHRQPETRAIMNWIKQEHFTASASLHGVIILPLTLFVKLFDYLNLVDRPVMFLWSSLLCQVVSHISVSISKFRVPQKVISRTNLFSLMSFLFSACYMEWLWSFVNFASNHFMLNLSSLSQKIKCIGKSYLRCNWWVGCC